MSESVYAGLTSQTIDVFLGDSSSTTGGGLTGLVFNTASLTCYYRKGATGTPTAITLATQTVGGAWSSGGFVAVDATNMPGVYRFDIPNVVVDSEGFATVYFRGAANLIPTAIRVDCRPLPADVKKLLGTAWLTPGTAGTPDVNVKLISDDATAADNAEAFFDGTGYAGTNNVIPTVTTLTNLPTIPANWLTAAGTAADFTTEIQSGLATQTSVDDLPTNAELATALAAADDAVLAQVALVKAKTDNLPSDPADASDIATAFGTVNTNLTAIASYLDTEIAAILADTNEIQTDWANGGRLDVILDATAASASSADTNALAAKTAAEALPTLVQFLAGGDVDGYSLEQCLKLILSACAAKLSGAGTNTNTFRAADDSKNRIVATVDADGNRTAVTLDATG